MSVFTGLKAEMEGTNAAMSLIPHHKKDVELFGVGPEEATKILRGLGHLSCEERLRELGLSSLVK